MLTAYFDCFSGISGDMTLAALIACGLDPDDLRRDLDLLHLPGWSLQVSSVERNGIGAVDVTVSQVEDTGHGRHLSDIRDLLDASALPAQVKADALRVFTRLAEAEAHVHNTTVERIHFHEVGALDAIVDIVGACAGLHRLGVERVYCSPLPMGRGFVHCAHGVIPLPAPAVIELTKGVPTYGVPIEGELVTPTGAALAVSLSHGFGGMPPLRLRSAGYGAGKKEFEDRPNLLRILLGEADESLPAQEVVEIQANLDDFSPQLYEPLMQRLFEEGALDVTLTPTIMKKGRPATTLGVLCEPDCLDTLARRIFRETTTLGVRYSTHRRICLPRRWETVSTAYGPVRIKIGTLDGETTSAMPEYADVQARAEEQDVPTKVVHAAALSAYYAGAWSEE